MRFLIDNALSPLVSLRLNQAGHDSAHVRDFAMQGASDEEILRLGCEQQRIIVTYDTDFGAILAAGKLTRPSLILLRLPLPLRPAECGDLILRNLPAIQGPLTAGCVAVFSYDQIRIRQLPI